MSVRLTAIMLKDLQFSHGGRVGEMACLMSAAVYSCSSGIYFPFNSARTSIGSFFVETFTIRSVNSKVIGEPFFWRLHL